MYTVSHLHLSKLVTHNIWNSLSKGNNNDINETMIDTNNSSYTKLSNWWDFF